MTRKVHGGGRHSQFGECPNACGCWDCAAAFVDENTATEDTPCLGDDCIACASFKAEVRRCATCGAGTWHRLPERKCLKCGDGPGTPFA